MNVKFSNDDLHIFNTGAAVEFWMAARRRFSSAKRSRRLAE